MKHIALFFFSLMMLFCYSASSQTPAWIDPSTRAQKYPSGSYYSGIAYENIYGNNSADAIKRAESSARAEALSTILVSLRSSSEHSKFSQIINGDEEFSKIYRSETRIETAFDDVPGLKVEHYVSGSQVTAFAYVRKLELMQYYDRKITSSLAKIETTLDNADQYVSRGEKIKARELAKTAVKNAAELENTQRILLAVDGSADIQMSQYSALSKRLVKTISELKNATAIYLDCKATEGQKPYSALASDVKSSLSNLGVNFVNDKKSADWTITVNAEVARTNAVSYGSSDTTYFVWIDGDLSVLKNATGQVVYSGSLSDLKPNHPDGIKGCHTNGYHYATRDAYKETSGILSEKLSELIKN